MSEKTLDKEINISPENSEVFARGREIVLAAPQLYVDVDIETDGWAGYGSMLSIGAQSPTGESFYSEIKPLFEEFVPSQREFAETHGLERERLLREAPDYQEVMAKFQDWVKGLQAEHGKPPVFTAFNAGFDFGFVQQYFLKAGLDNPFGSAPFDLKSLSLAMSQNWDWSRTSKNHLPTEIVPNGDFTHHALEDAQYQQLLHFGMVASLGHKIYTHSTSNENIGNNNGTADQIHKSIESTEHEAAVARADKIAELLRQDFDDSFDGETVGGIKASGGQSPRMQKLQAERDHAVCELLAEGNSTLTAQVLTKRGLSYAVLRYGLDAPIDWDSLENELLENELFGVVKNLNKFPHIDRDALGHRLIEKGQAFLVAEHLEEFPNIDKNQLFTALIEQKQLSHVEYKLDAIIASAVDRDTIAKQLIDLGWVEFVASRLDQFPNLDRKAFAEHLISLGPYAWRIILNSPNEFPGVDHQELASKLADFDKTQTFKSK